MNKLNQTYTVVLESLVTTVLVFNKVQKICSLEWWVLKSKH